MAFYYKMLFRTKNISIAKIHKRSDKDSLLFIDLHPLPLILIFIR